MTLAFFQERLAEAIGSSTGRIMETLRELDERTSIFSSVAAEH